MTDIGSRTAGSDINVINNIAGRDISFYRNQRVILENRQVIPLTTIIGTKMVQGVDIVIGILFILYLSHRLLFHLHLYKSHVNRILSAIRVEEENVKTLNKAVANIIEVTIGRFAIYMDMIIFGIVFTSSYLRIVYTIQTVDPYQASRFLPGDGQEAYDIHTRGMYQTTPDHVDNRTGDVLPIPEHSLYPVSNYIPSNFKSIFMVILVLYLISFIIYTIYSIYNHRKSILLLINWDRKLKNKNNTKLRYKDKFYLNLIKLLSNESSVSFTNHPYSSLSTENPDENEEQDTIKSNFPGRLLVGEEDVLKLSNRDSFFVHILGENAFYGLYIHIIVRCVDYACVLILANEAGKTSMYSELIMLIYLFLLFIIIIVYILCDIYFLGARSLLIPYAYFIFIPLGLVIELPTIHSNRVYVDVMCGIILFVVVVIALPLHFWKTSLEFIKRHMNEISPQNRNRYQIIRKTKET